MQRKELKDQRTELELTRVVHQETTNILEQQKRFQLKSNLVQSYNIIIEHNNQKITSLKSKRIQALSREANELNKENEKYLRKLENLLKSMEKDFG